ncbi:MAG: pilus assembly protein CpaC [Rhizobiaceae bacterium]|nr:pilus assembly protein CpaC [Rhizobiaceae bacterium]
MIPQVPKSSNINSNPKQTSQLAMNTSIQSEKICANSQIGGSRQVVGLAASVALIASTIVHPLTLNSAQAQSTNKNYVQITPENAAVPKMINLGLNKSLVVDLPAEANDVLVANPTVADAVMRTSRRIYLFGKQIGQTNIFVFDGSGKQIAAMEILIERDITGLEASLARLIPQSNIRAEMINDNIVLTGTVATPLDATKAVSLARIFVTGGEQAGNASADPNNLASLFGEEDQSSIVNLMKIEGQDQVMLKVTIAEVQRLVTKQLGIDTAITNPTSDGFGFSIGGGVSQQSIRGAAASTLGIGYGLNALQTQMRAMEIAGVVRTLAEPSLTSVSGEEAEFRVGGSWQTPTSFEENEDGLAVTYKERPYGIYLKFTPTVLSEGRISLQMSTEVQEPTPVGSTTQTQRASAWGTRNRRASTTVELPSGGSMAIAGLVQDDVRQAISGFPGLAKLPIVGTLFRSREFQRNESELVIIVTPYLVRPTARKNLAQPDENFHPASESASIFMGRVNRVYGTKQGNLPKGRYTGSIGFILK